MIRVLLAVLVLAFQPPPPDRLPSPQPPAVAGQPEPPRPTPRQGVPSTQATATVTMFWTQSAPTLATITGSYLYGYYIDTATSTIAITATCTDTTPPTQGLFACQGQMTSLVNGTHTYTLEVQCANCTDPKNVKSGGVSYTYAGSSMVQAASQLTIESGSGTNIPPATAIVDSKGATWTQSAAVPAACPPSVTGHPAADCLDQLRNGAIVGLGSEIYYANRKVYVKGPAGPNVNHWWQYLDAAGCPSSNTAACWTDLGTTKPTR